MPDKPESPIGKTPRVDAIAHFGAWGSPVDLNSAYVEMVDLARQLERELSEAERERDEAKRLIKNLAPTGRYNGLDIEAWYQRAEALERANAGLIERCAKVCEKRIEDRFTEHGVTEYDTNASYYPKAYAWCETADEEAEDCADCGVCALSVGEEENAAKRLQSLHMRNLRCGCHNLPLTECPHGQT